MPKQKSLLADILAHAGSTKKGPQSWFAKLPEDMREQLLELHREFHAGTYRSICATSLARGVIQACEDRGHKSATVGVIVKWLREKR